MIERMFAIQLDGTVSLRRWSAILGAWNESLCEISMHVGEKHVLSISIDGLTYGSATAEVSAAFDAEPVAVQFTKTYDALGRGLRHGNLADVPASLQSCGEKLLEATRIDGDGGVILSSETGDFVISPDSKQVESASQRTVPDQVVAYGAVSGRLQSLSNRGALTAVVFDEVHDVPVRISLTDELRDVARELWDMNVVVEGRVRRAPDTGRPLSMTEVQSIQRIVKPKDPFAWRKARGVLAHIHPEKRSEQLIREARDG